MAPLPLAEDWCLGGGEDCELVLALEPAGAQARVGGQPGSSVLGVLVAGPAGALGWASGEAWPGGEGEIGGVRGYSHFALVI